MPYRTMMSTNSSQVGRQVTLRWKSDKWLFDEERLGNVTNISQAGSITSNSYSAQHHGLPCDESTTESTHSKFLSPKMMILLIRPQARNRPARSHLNESLIKTMRLSTPSALSRRNSQKLTTLIIIPLILSREFSRINLTIGT